MLHRLTMVSMDLHRQRVRDRRRAQLARVLGADLRALRLRAGMTQQRLADELGVTRAYVSIVEAGDCTPSLARTLELRDVLLEPGASRAA